MPFRCAAPGCKGNYLKGPKVSVFKFPSDPDLLQQWIRAIHRDNFLPNKSSRICELHFTENDIIREDTMYSETSGELISAPLRYPKLREGAVPSKFPNCPEYVSKKVNSRTPPEERKYQKEMRSIQNAISDSISTKAAYDEAHAIKTLNDVFKKISLLDISDDWSVIKKNDNIIICCIRFSPAPIITKSIHIDSNLNINIYIDNVFIKQLSNLRFPFKLNCINDVMNIVNNMNSLNSKNMCSESNIISVIQNLVMELKNTLQSSKENAAIFISEQLSLLLCEKHHVRYSPEFLIFTSLLFSVSPHAYRFLRNSGHFILPHPHTLRRICSTFCLDPVIEQTDEYFLSYIKQKFNALQGKDITVCLLMDEIHIAPSLDYKSGNIVGSSFNNNECATSCYVFMIQSFLSPYNDVVHILPIYKITADALHSVVKKVVLGLENVGFRIICISSDNNAINGKAMSYFATPPKLSIVYKHPIDHTRPLFFLFDPVHIFKCIRNNWLNQRNNGQCMHFPDFHDNSKVRTASFEVLKKIYSLESGNLLKYAYGLSLKALCPSNLERQNVSLVLQIFNEHVIHGLKQFSKKCQDSQHCEETSSYIELIYTWWCIMNVKNMYKGEHKRNKYDMPLTNKNDEQSNIFLNRFLSWLDAWGALNYSSGVLSNQTLVALKHTTYGVLELINYCSAELGFSYILTGKVQTDPLERRFGKFRQLAGSQYNVCLRQVFEIEKKIASAKCSPIKNFISKIW